MPFGGRVHRLGQLEIKAGETPGIMGGEADGHPVVDVRPFRMMVEPFSLFAYLDHKGQRCFEIGEHELSPQMVSLARPASKSGQHGLDIGVGQR